MTVGNVKEKPLAILRVGFRKLRLYPDRIEGRGGGPIDGARARIETRGFRGQVTYVIVEGPQVAIAEEMSSRGRLVRRQAQRFVARVNSAASARE